MQGGGAAGAAAAAPSEMDFATVLATFSPELREEVLLTSEEDLINSLPPALLAEAQALRQRVMQAYRSDPSIAQYLSAISLVFCLFPVHRLHGLHFCTAGSNIVSSTVSLTVMAVLFVMLVWVLCRDNRAPAGGRGVVFVGAPGGGPNSAAYARPQYGARRNGGPAGPSSIQAQIQENIARNAERAPEGPPQVSTPPASAPALCMHHLYLSCLHVLLQVCPVIAV